MDETTTEVARTTIDSPVRERVWGRAAARCVLCSKWLVDEREYWHSIPVGQVAHIVAASSGPKAPRGKSPLDAAERAAEENLLLLCGDCHKRVDSRQYRDTYTVDFLRAKKEQHERRVREVTDFATLRPATVLTVTASVRGSVAPATKAQVGEALRQSGLTGMGADTRTGAFDVDLRHNEGEPWTWDVSKNAIDRAVAQVQEAVAAQDTGAVAVFAMAPIPTLVYLGAALDDKTEVRLFPRRRGDDVDVWSWAESTRETQSFSTHLPDDSEIHARASDVVLLAEVTSEVSVSRAPAALADFPVARLRAEGGYGPDAVASPADLESFASAWRNLLAKAELRWPLAERYHLIASVPITAAVTLGRHRMRGAHPDFVVYQRLSNGTYEKALEVVG